MLPRALTTLVTVDEDADTGTAKVVPSLRTIEVTLELTAKVVPETVTAAPDGPTVGPAGAATGLPATPADAADVTTSAVVALSVTFNSQ